jgi:hypothetical protein
VSAYPTLVPAVPPTLPPSAVPPACRPGFTNTLGTELQVQINQGEAYHCYDLRGLSSPARLNVGDFSDDCWENSPHPLGQSAGSGVIGIQLVVPSAANMTRDFDICLTSLTIE